MIDSNAEWKLKISLGKTFFLLLCVCLSGEFFMLKWVRRAFLCFIPPRRKAKGENFCRDFSFVLGKPTWYQISRVLLERRVSSGNRGKLIKISIHAVSNPMHSLNRIQALGIISFDPRWIASCCDQKLKMDEKENEGKFESSRRKTKCVKIWHCQEA